MSRFFDDLQEALEEAISYAKGEATGARVTRYEIDPIVEYSASDIKNLRKNAQMTQRLFAMYMGVSVKTVESWEQGKSHPNGTAFRLMQVLSSPGDKKPQFVKITKI